MLPPRPTRLASASHVRHWREMVAAGRADAPLRARRPGVEDAPHVAPFYSLLGLRFPPPYLAHDLLAARAARAAGDPTRLSDAPGRTAARRASS